MRRIMRTLGAAVLLAVVTVGGAAAPATADAASDHRAFVQAGFDGTTDAEYRAWVEALAATPDGPMMHHSALAALAGTDEELRAYADGGYRTAWRADEEIRLARIMTRTDTDSIVYRSIERVLESPDPQDMTDFLNTGLADAQYADDRLAAARMLDGASNNSGPALGAAAEAALDGTREELREFILHGQFVARELDAQAAVPAPVPAAPVPAAPVPAAPAPAPAAPAAAAPAAPAPAAAPTSRATSRHAVLAATGGAVDEGPLAALAAATLVGGAGLVVLARRRRAA